MTTSEFTFVSATPVIPVDDVAKAGTFYTDNLGFELAFEAGDYRGVIRGPIMLHLDGYMTAAKGEVTCRIDVRNVDGIYAEVEPKGIVDPAEPLEDKPWGTRQFSVRDCCGNKITFVEAQ